MSKDSCPTISDSRTVKFEKLQIVCDGKTGYTTLIVDGVDRSETTTAIKFEQRDGDIFCELESCIFLSPNNERKREMKEILQQD